VIAECMGALSLASWVYLLVGRGEFWRMKIEPLPRRTSSPRRIAVIVPARNEASLVGHATESLVRQDYQGPFHIFLVDDHSTDATSEVALKAAERAGHINSLTIVQARELPSGWTGKLWAGSEGIRAAEAFQPDYLWFSDADISHDPSVLRDLVQRLERDNLDLVSLMVKLRSNSFAEKLLIPAFVFFFLKLYPPAWVNQASRRTAAAAGGCILIRREALMRIGGIAAIHDQLIDDCALARAVKKHGKIWLGLTEQSTSLREYGTFRDIGHMISRTAFTQLHHSTLLLLGTIIGMSVIYVAPLALLATSRTAAILGLCSLAMMWVAYAPTLRLYRQSFAWALLLPLTALFYVGATVNSAMQCWTGRGGSWKGRAQDLPAAE